MVAPDPIQVKIDYFFTAPEQEPPQAGEPSTLHLLRREIQDSLVDLICVFPGGAIQPEESFRQRIVATENRLTTRRHFASTILILGGIDLLGKFFAGNDITGEVGKRFTDFVDAYMTRDSADALWAVRNSLMHSFGLYDRPVGSRPSLKTVLEHRLPAPIPDAATAFDSQQRWVIYTPLLYTDFTKAVEAYRDRLGTDQQLRQNFDAMYPNYGRVAVW